MNARPRNTGWPGYTFAAAILGVVWYEVVAAALLNWGRPEGSFVFALIAVAVTGLFRRRIIASHDLVFDVLLGILIPIVGIATVSLGISVMGVAIGGRMDQIPWLFMYPLYGVYAVMTNAWHLVLPLGLLSQLVMKAAGRRVWPELATRDASSSRPDR